MGKRNSLIVGYVALGVAVFLAIFSHFEIVRIYGLVSGETRMKIQARSTSAGDGLIVLGLCIVGSMGLYLGWKSN